jgi:hypothetical protein
MTMWVFAHLLTLCDDDGDDDDDVDDDDDDVDYE